MKTRRQFLASSTTTTAAALGLTGCQKPDEPGFIDAHVHVWTPDTKRYPIAQKYTVEQMKPPSFTPEELFAHSKPAGVSRVVLIQMSFYGFDNSYMLDAMAAYPGVFGGVAVIDENAPDVKATMLELAKSGVRGFRIRSTRASAETWPDSKGTVEMWETGAEHNLSMCLLADPDSLPAVLEMSRKFPETPIVIDHCARIGVSGSIEQSDLDALLKLSDQENVSVKTSAFYALGKKAAPYEDLGPMIKQLRDAYGANRLMWASDCPYQVVRGHTYENAIALVRDRLDFLTAEDREWMLRKTAESIFF
ncbi:amidohydrolase family protein [bacterium]|nr:amidohydrolase family protein [bacterium]MDC0258887.1 amidohydrolase family protein [Verrucomicrobiales bacterium]